MTRDSLTREELLVLLIEECSEVIQAATKCLRFGYDREWPGYGKNDAVLAKEPCPGLSPLDDKTAAAVLQKLIEVAEQYHDCATRHRALSEAVAEPL